MQQKGYQFSFKRLEVVHFFYMIWHLEYSKIPTHIYRAFPEEYCDADMYK